jgi:hypothetical protein
MRAGDVADFVVGAGDHRVCIVVAVVVEVVGGTPFGVFVDVVAVVVVVARGAHC